MFKTGLKAGGIFFIFGNNWGILAIIGLALGVFPRFLAMALFFQHPSLFFFLGHGKLIGAFCPWLSAFLLGSFCSIALFESGIKRNID